VRSESPPRALVGRDHEIALLTAAVAEVAAGRGRTVWLEGEPGIGKSTVLAAGLADARRSGCEVFWENADEARRRFPLWVLLDCLRVGSRSTDPVRAEIAALLRGEGSTGLTPEDTTAVVAERLLVLVDRLCAVSPVVLVVDDLHWADEASLAVWGRLHSATGQLPLLLVGASRSVPARVELAALRASLTGGDPIVTTLAPLTAGEAVDVVGSLVEAAPGPRLRHLAGQAGGNPLYLRELVDALLREERVQVVAGVAELVRPEADRPASLATTIARRLRFLSPAASAVLRLAALLGAEFPLDHLRAATDRTDTELTAVMKEAIGAGVLTEAGPDGRYAFRHGLIQRALSDEVPPAVRTGLHRHLAQVMADAGAPMERVAEHLLAAPKVVDGWVVDWVTSVAPMLIYRAPHIAVDLLERVRDVTPAGEPRLEHVETSLVTAHFLLGHNEDAEVRARSVLAVTGDPAVAGRMTWILGYTLLRSLRAAEALTVTREALSGLTPVWTARVRALQAMILTQLGGARVDEAESTARQAEEDGERVGDAFAIAYALHAQSLLQSRHHRDLAALLTLLDKALAVLSDQPETTDLRLLILGNRIAALENLGRPAEVDRAIGETVTLTERVGTPQRLVMIRLVAADHFFISGRWDDALAELDAVGEMASSAPLALVMRHGLGALIAGHRDERAVAEGHLREVAHLEVTGTELGQFALHVAAAKALAAEREGRLDQALALLSTALDPSAARSEDSPLWRPEVVRLAVLVGDRVLARAATDACVDEHAQTPTPSRKAAAEHCQGLVSADAALLVSAAGRYEQVGMPVFRAQALEAAAVRLAERGDAAAAHDPYAAAIEIYTQLGAGWDILRADSRLRALGVRRGARGTRRRPATGWAALTPTEVRVAELVAEGRSNPDIAAELLLSRRTVQGHVSHILTKLGGHSRVDIARAAMHHPGS
jgi:DNA-binding CsgD family transcriptional regulator/tetratricopeptide (TPR) repeat protein